MQVAARSSRVWVAERALDHRQRDPFMQQLDRVGMRELVRGYAPAHACLDRVRWSSSRAAPSDQR